MCELFDLRGLYMCPYPASPLEKHRMLQTDILNTPGETRDPMVASLSAWTRLINDAILKLKEE